MTNFRRESTISHLNCEERRRQLTSLKFLLLVANSSWDRAITEVPDPVSPNRDRVLAAVLTQGRGSAGIVRKSDIWRTIAPNRRKRALADRTTNQVSTKMVSSIEIEILKEIMDDPSVLAV